MRYVTAGLQDVCASWGPLYAVSTLINLNCVLSLVCVNIIFSIDTSRSIFSFFLWILSCKFVIVVYRNTTHINLSVAIPIHYTKTHILTKTKAVKYIYPHLFRHTTATALFKQYSQQNVYKPMNLFVGY